MSKVLQKKWLRNYTILCIWVFFLELLLLFPAKTFINFTLIFELTVLPICLMLLDTVLDWVTKKCIDVSVSYISYYFYHKGSLDNAIFLCANFRNSWYAWMWIVVFEALPMLYIFVASNWIKHLLFYLGLSWEI